MIPSGYKTSKVYCAKPTDGTGDLTFTRSNDTATRVASSGLIEKVRTNLVLQSEAFNTTWTASRGSVTANATTAPNGTTTADKFVADTQVNPHFVSQAISGLTNGGIYTSSVYAKASEWNSIAIFRGDSAVGVSFRLDTQATSVIVGTPTTYSITDAGNGWYRCSVSFAIASTSDGAQIRVGNNDAFSIAGDNINGLFLWGSQYEVSDFGATDYIATTTAAVSVGPVANVPRLDYLNSTCPKLLLEPQRTNLLAYSEQFDNGYWTKSANTTITANTHISPDGTQNADTYSVSGSGITTQLYRVVTTSGTKQVLSVFIKYLSGSGTDLRLSLATVGSLGADLTFSNAGATLTGVKGANVDTLTIDNYGNNWFRVSIVVSYASATAEFNLFRSAGTGTDAYAVWGAGFEGNSTYATSYIPTLGAAVTRGEDAAVKTGISSLIGQTEGTLFADFFYVGNTQAEIIDVSDGTENNRIMFYVSAGSQAQVYVTNGGSSDGFISTSFNMVAGTEYKIAIGYKANDLVLYINGTQIGTDTSLAIPATSKLTISNGGAGNYPMASRVAQALLFKTRLTNQELLDLTTI